MATVDQVDDLERMDVMPKRQPLLLTKDQAAELLTISVRMLERLVATGSIVPTRIGGAIRFSPAQLEAFIERSTTSRVAWPTLRGRHRFPRH
jgi:excisionase family DNA binding protein